MDPITISLAVGVASKAFDAIKSGFAMGRDLEQMSGDIGRWMGAASDVDNAEKQAKNPGVFGKVFGGGSIEATALQAYAAKKKLEEQRYELKMFLNLTHGPQAYDELLQMEGKIRKERQETIYKQQQLRKQIGEAIGWLFLVLVIGVMLLALASVFSSKAYGKELTYQQKIWHGIIAEPKYVTCRLKKQKVYKDKMACIYRGANKTHEIEFTDIRIGCPKQYKCVHNPNSSEPNIDDVMKSLRDIAK
jgi:tetrahydromethanopterin S-methyltransferase subunit G